MKCHPCKSLVGPLVGLILLAIALPYVTLSSSRSAKTTAIAQEYAGPVTRETPRVNFSSDAGSDPIADSHADPTDSLASDREGTSTSVELERERPVPGASSKPVELPEWVMAPPSGEGSQHYSLIHSDYHATERESRRALDDEIRQAAEAYIADYLNDSRAPLLLGYSVREIKSRILNPAYLHHEVREFSFGMMHQTHALLDFPPEFREELDRRWSHVIQAGRIVTAGGATVGVLMLLALTLGILRWNQRASGFGGAALQWLAVAAILSMAIIGIWSARSSTDWLQWLLNQTYW